ARVGDLAAVGQRSKRLQAEIDAGIVASAWQRPRGHIGTGDRNVPAISLAADGDRLGCTREGTRPPDRDAPDLGEDQTAIVKPRAVAIFLEGEGLEAITALEAWKAGLLTPLHAAEEHLVGLVEPRQHILEHMAVDGGIVWELGADVLELGFLLVAR